jgi:membrane protease YdiL (CAAX protease family)
MSALREFWAYIRRPFFTESKDPLSWQAIPVLGKLLLTNFALSIAAFMLAHYVFALADTDRPARSSDWMSTFSLRKLFIIAVAAPFLEELLFRSWLRKRWGVKYIFPFAAVLPIWFLGSFFQVEIPPFLMGAIISALFGLAIYMFTTFSDQDSAAYVERVFPFAFYTSALTFACLHLTNFNVDEIGILGIIVVLPQFISGLFYGYIVKRFGFWTGFLCHGFWNGSLTFLSLALS